MWFYYCVLFLLFIFLILLHLFYVCLLWRINVFINVVHRELQFREFPRQETENIPVLGLSSYEHSVISLLSSSGFTSKHSNSMKLPAYTQHGKCICTRTDHVWTHKRVLVIITEDNSSSCFASVMQKQVNYHPLNSIYDILVDKLKQMWENLQGEAWICLW